MPNKDGLGFLTQLGESHQGLPCKAIAMSGGGRIGHRNYPDGVLELGVDDVLEKPIGMDDLLNCIERQLG